MHEDEKTFTHESYGMVGLYRVSSSGKRRLFGSSLDNHFTTIRLRVHRAKRVHHLARDWYHDDGGLPEIEIELSAAQFAEFVTTPNVGSGVPCTILSVQGRRMEDPPDEHATEVEEVRHGFDDRMRKLASSVSKVVDEVDSILEAGKVSKSTREKVKAPLGRIAQEIGSNIPFVLRQFQEAAGKITTAAKAEADAFLTRAIHLAGIKAISEASEGPPLVLPGPVASQDKS